MMPLKVCVDPGHGGRDPGAVAGGVRECDVALRFADALADVLLERGHKVVQTRSDDSDLAPPRLREWKGKDLAQRSSISNRFGCDAFVSIHCNAAAREGANGAWVLHDQDSSKGKALARLVFAELAKIPGVADADPEAEVFPDDSPQTGGRDLAVLGPATNAPAILVELAFLTNPEDRAQLLADATPTAVAEAVVRGLEAWNDAGRAVR